MRTYKPPKPSLNPVERIERALRERRFPEAVQLALDESSRPDLLFQAVLGRVRGWRESGQTNFATDLIRKVWSRMGDDPHRTGPLAAELAACGAVSEALLLAPDAAPIRAVAADAAVARGSSGRGLLPDELQPAFDALLVAFAAFAAGSDDEAREQLNAIGLSSPFAEWKLLLRGLMAWHVGDDARALDNWQRLVPTRLPAGYVMVLRASIDSAYRHSLPAPLQSACAKAGDYLLGHPAIASVRQFQAALADGKIADTLRHAQKLIEDVQVAVPDGPTRVTEAVAQAIVQRGQLSDVEQVAKKLPPLPTDPTFDLMRSHVAAAHGKPASARDYILKYELALAARPEVFGAETHRARALCWWRAGALALAARAESNNPFAPRRPTGKLSGPSAEECFRRAEELAGDLLVVLESRFALIVGSKDVDAIIAAGEKLLAKRPNDRDALMQLYGTCTEAGRVVDRLRFAERLLAVDPLDGMSQGMAAVARRSRAREMACAGDLAGARALAEAALSACPAFVASGRILLACLALLAGDEAEWAAQLTQLPATVLESERALRTIIESTALGLPNNFRTRANATLKAALARPLSLDEANGLLSAFADLHRDGLTYRGHKTHAKKAAAQLVAAAKQSGSTAAQLERCARLAFAADWPDTALDLSTVGHHLFPAEPQFHSLAATALINSGDPRKLMRASSHLRQAQALLDRLPPERRPADLLKEIQEIHQQLNLLLPGGTFGSMVERLAGMFGQFNPDFDEDEF